MSKMQEAQFKTGLRFCWLSLLALPVGLLAIGGGPCAGPRNSLGSVILLTVGAFCVSCSLFGIQRILRRFNAAKNLWRMIGALSVLTAVVPILGGGAYLFIGYESLQSFLRY